VLRRTTGSKHYHHPLVGDLRLDYEALTPTGDPDQVLGLHTAEPGSPSEQALRLLAGWTHEVTGTRGRHTGDTVSPEAADIPRIATEP